MSLPADSASTTSRPSAGWYIAPILLAIIGSAIMWFVLKDENHPESQKMIKKGWIIGIIITILCYGWMIPFLILPLFWFF